MKRSVKFFLVALVGIFAMSLSLTGCQPSLEEAVAEIQKECPKDMDGGGKMLNVELTGENLVFTFSDPETEVRFDDAEFSLLFELLKETVNKEMLKKLKSDRKTKKMLQECKEKGKGVVINMVGDKSKKELEFCKIKAEDIDI
ncbi:MAG: hypothetical protein J5644_01000 [Bacteroidales bacterium]|nr:hypothetical protein [Bacteroidales bacterium]